MQQTGERERGRELCGECSWIPLAVEAPVKDARGTLGAHLGQDLLPFSASDRKLKSKQAANKVRLSQLASVLLFLFFFPFCMPAVDWSRGSHFNLNLKFFGLTQLDSTQRSSTQFVSIRFDSSRFEFFVVRAR